MKQKIEYGIDLGTTNSALARFEKGHVRIIKSERLQKDTTPSCVHYTKRGQLLVGDAAFSRLSIDPENTKTEFKRTMGTEVTYSFPSLSKAFTSEELSAEVLRMLRSYVKDDECDAAVVTVPADFDQVQIEATQRAVELAGFEYCELLQEPIAASLAYLLEEENVGGHWLVFDIGGGTFDAALVNADRGVVRVVDIAGDNYLGGKNMDLLIVDELILPQMRKEFKIDKLLMDPVRRRRLQSIWKKYAEQYKINLSTDRRVIIEADDPSVMQDDEGRDIDICVTVEREQFEDLIRPLMDRAVTLVKKLMARNRMETRELRTVLCIGGPTFIPYVRERIQKEINENIDVNIDPMTAVAVGAALFASTKTIPYALRQRDLSRIQLELTHPHTTVEKEAKVEIRLDREKNTAALPEVLALHATRHDQGWQSGKLEFKDDKVAFTVTLEPGATNTFTLQLFDGTGRKILAEPGSFSILHGIEISNPPLPHDIGVEADSETLGHTLVPLVLKGQKLPAVGKKSFRTKSMLRPGTSEDVFRIIVREGEMNTRPIRNVMVGEIAITGADLSKAIPKDSPVEITLRMDESRRISVSAYFPDIDETIQNVLETSFRAGVVDQQRIATEIAEELDRVLRIRKIAEATGNPFQHELAESEQALHEMEHTNTSREGDADSGFGIRNRLNEVQVRMDDIESKMEWKAVEYELNETYKHARKIVEIFGTAPHRAALTAVCEEMDAAIHNRDIPAAKAVTVKFSEVRNNLLVEQPGFWIAILNNIQSTFDKIHWLNKKRASELAGEGRQILGTAYSLKDIQRIVRDLWNLMTPEEQKKTQRVRADIPMYRV